MIIINILCDKCQIVSFCIKILLFHAIFWDSFVIALCCSSFYLFSCKNLNFCFPAQTDWEASAVSQNFLARLLYFSQQEEREHSNVHNFLPDLHNNPSMFFKSLGIHENSNAILIRLYSQCTLHWSITKWFQVTFVENCLWQLLPELIWLFMMSFVTIVMTFLGNTNF